MTITTLNTDELAKELDELRTDIECHEEVVEEGETDSPFLMDDGDLHDAQERVKAIEELLDEVPAHETLIREDCFKEYAQELAHDLGAMEYASWPYCHIDWDAAAKALKQDYTEVTYDGDTWLVRA